MPHFGWPHPGLGKCTPFAEIGAGSRHELILRLYFKKNYPFFRKSLRITAWFCSRKCNALLWLERFPVSDVYYHLLFTINDLRDEITKILLSVRFESISSYGINFFLALVFEGH
jgi:hypothetical protein